MSWFFIALIAPIMFAISNYIDKFLINRYFKSGGVGALIIYSALIGILLMPIFFFLDPNVLNISPSMALLIMASGAIYIISLLPYLYAIQYDDVSSAMPLFQTIPLFSYVLAFFLLNETLTITQIFASLMVITGAIILNVQKGSGRYKFNYRVFWLMLLSAFLIALNGVLFKFVAVGSDFLTTSFWENVGFSLVAIFLLVFVKSYRQQFIDNIKVNSKFILSLNFFNEAINIIGKITLSFATLLAPLALARVVSSFHPLFVITIGILLTKFWPQIVKEDIKSSHVLQKIIAVIIMIVGGFYLTR